MVALGETVEPKGSGADMTVDSGEGEGPGDSVDSVEIEVMEVAVAAAGVQPRTTPCNPYRVETCSDRATKAGPRKRN